MNYTSQRTEHGYDFGAQMGVARNTATKYCTRLYWTCPADDVCETMHGNRAENINNLQTK